MSLKVWDVPEPHHVYAIGADVAEGIKDGAYSAAFVLDIGTSEQVAEWWGHCSPSDFGQILYNLGLYYNRALVAPESWPGPGGVTTAKLHDLGYNHIYQRVAGHTSQRLDDDLRGWATDSATKPRMISALDDALRSHAICIKSKELLSEIRSYIYNEAGKMVPSPGCFSDRVIAAAIAWSISRNIAETVNYDAPRLRNSLQSANLSGMVSQPQWRGPRMGVRTE